MQVIEWCGLLPYVRIGAEGHGIRRLFLQPAVIFQVAVHVQPGCVYQDDAFQRVGNARFLKPPIVRRNKGRQVPACRMTGYKHPVRIAAIIRNMRVHPGQ